MEALQTKSYKLIPASSIHALLLQWLLNPQSSDLTKATIQSIDWDHVFHYYQAEENQDQFRIFIDYLCKVDYHQLCNHPLIPLAQRQLLPRILVRISQAHQNTSSQITQNLQILQQLLEQQETLLKNYFYHSPKALVNLLKDMSEYKQQQTLFADLKACLPKLYELALITYIQLPTKPAYRFAIAEMRQQLLSWFHDLALMMNQLSPEQLAKLQTARYFNNLEGRQKLQEILNREDRGMRLPPHIGMKTYGLPKCLDEKPCISRAQHGLLRSWL